MASEATIFFARAASLILPGHATAQRLLLMHAKAVQTTHVFLLPRARSRKRLADRGSQIHPESFASTTQTKGLGGDIREQFRELQPQGFSRCISLPGFLCWGRPRGSCSNCLFSLWLFEHRHGQQCMLLDGSGIAQTANLQTTDRLLLPIKKRIFIRLQVPEGCRAASAGLLSRGCLECLLSKDEVGNSLEDYLTPMLSLRLFDAHLLGAVRERNESELVSGDLLQAVGCSRHGIHSDHLPQVLVLQLRRGLEQLGVDSGEGSLLFAGSSGWCCFATAASSK